jgi:hypothetical protein
VQANEIASEIREEISALTDADLEESLSTTFESLFSAVVNETAGEEGILQKLRDGTLTAEDFERAGGDKPSVTELINGAATGPVESLEALLQIAELPLGSFGFPSLTAAFAGNIVTADQVTTGIGLFDAFGFDGNTGAGTQVLLDAMNSPVSLLLLTDQAGAAQVAVEAALKAEYQALAADGLTGEEASAFDQLLVDVQGLVAGLPDSAELLAFFRVMTVLEAGGSQVADLEAVVSDLQTLLGDQTLAGLGAERQQDFLQDLLDNVGAGYANKAAFLAEASPLFAYRSLLETLKGIASEATPNYSEIDFSSSAADSVTSVIGELAGLSVDGAVASAQNIADAQRFLSQMEGLRDAPTADSLQAFDAIAEFAIALNVAGTVSTAAQFETVLTDLRDGLPEGFAFDFSGLTLSREAVDFYLTAFDGLEQADAQLAMAAPFLTGDDRPSFVNFSNPGALLKTAFLDGLIVQAGNVAENIQAEILELDPELDGIGAIAKPLFERLYGEVVNDEPGQEGLLQKLRTGTLTVEDFERAGDAKPTVSGLLLSDAPTGPVESLEALLLIAESAPDDFAFSSLTAEFAGQVVSSAQVTRGIELFEAFAFDVVANAPLAVGGRDLLPGEQVLLDAMNAPTSLLLLTDQEGAARTAVTEALSAELAALDLGSSDSIPDGFAALLARVEGAIPSLVLEGTTGDDTLTGSAGAEFFLGGEGDDTFVLGGESAIDVLGDFSRIDGNADTLSVSEAGVGPVVHYEGVAEEQANPGDDVGLYVLSSLAGTGTTFAQVANYLDASSLFDDPAGDKAFVLAPNLETAVESDAVLLLATSSGEGAVSLETVAAFTALDFAELASFDGEELLFQVPSV